MNDREAVDKIVKTCSCLKWDSMLTEEFYSGHWCLPQIILDAVFSINARYKAATNVVQRYCEKAGIRSGCEQTVSDFLTFAAGYTVEDFASWILQNSQRTSPQGGILKVEAAIRYAEALREFEVNCLADKNKVLDSDRFCRHIRAIPGQHVSCDYFLMMLGREDLVKPDRRVLAFLSDCLDGEDVGGDRAYVLLNRAAKILKQQHPKIQPRFLDHMIWLHMNGKPS